MKSINYSIFFKTLAFLLIVVALTTAMVQLQYVARTGIDLETIIVPSYTDSISFMEIDANDAIMEVTDAINGLEVNSLGEGYYYYYSDGQEINTNLVVQDETFFEKYSGKVFELKEGNWFYEGDHYYSYYSSQINPSLKGYIAFSSEYINKAQSQWNLERVEALPITISILSCILGALILLIYVTVVAGKTHKLSPVHLSSLDTIPSDLFLIIYLIAATIWVMGLDGIFDYQSYGSSRLMAAMIFVGTISSIFLIVSGFTYLSIIRRIKAKQLIRNSLIFKFFFSIFDFFRSLFDGRTFKNNKLTQQLFYRQATFIGLSALMVFLTFLFILAPPLMILPPCLELLLIYWYVKGNRKTYEAIDKGFNESLEEQMKAERMKIQLVTNVSHDLKTPLTSIISYADLLSKETDLNETSREYVNILIDKSNRLKNIVSDLFDIAKSTSGDIVLDLETIDLKKLIEQTLADMEDEIVKSELNFKVKLPDHPIMVKADGKKMYRVFQNLIDNAIKYALHGTRVYIDLEKMNHKAFVSVKNTAGYEMDFTSEEILQRFSRGDASRSTEGNGLGLSIAESFTQVCGGKFILSIDGDLFKVTIEFDEVESGL